MDDKIYKLKKLGDVMNPLSKRLYTIKEAALYLGRPVWSVRELIWSGRLPSIKHPGERKIYLDILDLENYVNYGKQIYEFKG